MLIIYEIYWHMNIMGFLYSVFMCVSYVCKVDFDNKLMWSVIMLRVMSCLFEGKCQSEVIQYILKGDMAIVRANLLQISAVIHTGHTKTIQDEQVEDNIHILLFPRLSIPVTLIYLNCHFDFLFGSTFIKKKYEYEWQNNKDHEKD